MKSGNQNIAPHNFVAKHGRGLMRSRTLAVGEHKVLDERIRGVAAVRGADHAAQTQTRSTKCSVDSCWML